MIDKVSVKMLKFIRKKPNISIDELKTKYGDFAKDSIVFLEKGGYLIHETKGYYPVQGGAAPIKTNKFRISPKGLAYLQEIRKETRNYWIPIIWSNLIAAAALIVAIIDLVNKC